MTENEITEKIIGCAIEVHKEIGPGLLESAYLECLYFRLIQSGLFTEKQVALPLVYKGVRLDCGYRLDLMIEKQVVVEIRSTEGISKLHIAQVLSYLKLSNCRLGLLINFNVPLLKQGIKRVVNNL